MAKKSSPPSALENSPSLNEPGVRLLEGYQNEFAANQRSREQSFLTVVGFLGAVVVGYGYVYVDPGQNIRNIAAAAIVAQVLLFFGAWMITVVAYGFRMSQMISARIREYAQLVGPDKPFPPGYSSANILNDRIKRLLWMPDIFAVYFSIFPVVQTLVLISLTISQSVETAAAAGGSEVTDIALASSVLSVLFSLLVWFRYGRKLRRKLESWARA